jgi:hypothetical protein
MDRGEFEARWKKLVAESARATVNVGCVGCEQCEGCSDCTFCVQSKGLTRSHYCVSCDGCTDCAHCQRSAACLACQHCTECERCIGSAYLVRCVGCSACTYCFGCVGLAKRDFHILNEPYERQEYFALVAKLTRELRLG